MEKQTQLHVLITGRVQGVFFRARTKEVADRLGVRGWVKNLPEGSVEAVFEGDAPLVQEMMQWCHQGPPLSVVDQIKIRSSGSPSGFKDFQIHY